MTLKEKKKLLDIKKPFFWVLFAVSIIIIFIITLFFYFNRYLNTPTSTLKKEVEFTIGKGEGVRQIAKDLEEKGLIKDDVSLLIYLKITGHMGDLKAGIYKLNTNNSPKEIVDILTRGKVTSRRITIPEGWNNKQIGEYLEKQGIVRKNDFITAANKKYDYEFLKDLPVGASIEGFLFPDTYQIPYNATAEYIVKVMLENFDAKLTSTLRAEIKGSKYNFHQTLTLASIVEAEVVKPEDRKTVAGIFLARLEEGMKLESDATVNYALGDAKELITYDDIKVNSPYNTYLNQGLPTGPIGNPGIESINAVLYPKKTEFRYFLSAKGVTYYSKSLDEHEEKKAKYLN